MIENTFKILKSIEDKHLVFGWASIAKLKTGETLFDLQGDYIDPADLEEGAYEYVLNFRDTGIEHQPELRKKGKLVESCVFTKEKQKALGIPEGFLPEGWWVGFKIFDEVTWQAVKHGSLRMFSIQGVGKRKRLNKSKKTNKPLSFNDIITKFNPYHGKDGRFTGKNGAASFTFRTRDPKKQHMADAAVEREKQNTKKEPKKKKQHTVPDVSFERFPTSIAFGGGTKEDRKKANEITRRFVSQAQEGDVYRLGSNFGSVGGDEIKIVAYGRSPNKLGIDDGSNRHTIALSHTNAKKYIMNGARLTERITPEERKEKERKEREEFDNWWAEQEQKWKKEHNVAKSFNEIVEERAKTQKSLNIPAYDSFNNIITKFNPYHDRNGRFASRGMASSFTIRTHGANNQKQADNAILSEQQKVGSGHALEDNAVKNGRKIDKALTSEGNKIRNDFYETAALVDKDGNVLFHESQGSESSVVFNRSQKRKMKGAYLTHNHPGDSTFSPDDLDVLTGNGLAAIEAVGKTHRYRLSENNNLFANKDVKGKIRDRADFGSDFIYAENDFMARKTNKIYFSISQKYKNGEMTWKQFNSEKELLGRQIEEYCNQWLQENAKYYGYDYEDIWEG